MNELTLEVAGATATLDRRGGRLSGLEVGGHQVLAQVQGERLQAGCYPMVPWAGRLGEGRFEFAGHEHRLDPDMGPHAIHGLATNTEWDVAAEGVMTTSFGELWQLGGEATVVYALERLGLSCSLTVTATDCPMPAVLGWHPCFVRELDHEPESLSFEPRYMWERGADYLPTGSKVSIPDRPWDDCFGGVEHRPSLSWGDVLTLELVSPATTWVAFDELAEIICVEPQTDIPNAFNMARGAVLEPGESLTLDFEVRWSGTTLG